MLFIETGTLHEKPKNGCEQTSHILNMMFFLLVTQAYSDKVKKNPSAPNRSQTYDLPISTSDALPLSHILYTGLEKSPPSCPGQANHHAMQVISHLLKNQPQEPLETTHLRLSLTGLVAYYYWSSSRFL